MRSGSSPEQAQICVMVAADARVPGTRPNASGVAPAIRQINRYDSGVTSIAPAWATLIIIAVGVADVGPAQSIGRPHPAPATVVISVDEGRAKEGKAMVAVMEESTIVEREP